MIYLFEDKEDDQLSKIYRYSLPQEIKSQIVYANGNGNLVNKARELLDHGETVLVILDTVPANKSIRDIYISLRRISRQNGNRLIVWNIVCAEYYFIKCFGRDKRLRAFREENGFETVVDIKPYKDSELILTDEDRAFTKTFEKFCKLYIHKNGNACINSSHVFFADDCGCSTACENVSLGDKSKCYQMAYNFCLNDNTDALWDIHKKLLDITNKAIEEYNLAGYLNVKAYPSIV